MVEAKFHGNDTIGPGIITVYVSDGAHLASPVGLHFDSEDKQVKHQGFNLNRQQARELAAFLVLNT